ncbi:hypothetical protein AB3S75_006079 [Citrus x aurantiifolia]
MAWEKFQAKNMVAMILSSSLQYLCVVRISIAIRVCKDWRMIEALEKLVQGLATAKKQDPPASSGQDYETELIVGSHDHGIDIQPDSSNFNHRTYGWSRKQLHPRAHVGCSGPNFIRPYASLCPICSANFTRSLAYMQC